MNKKIEPSHLAKAVEDARMNRPEMKDRFGDSIVLGNKFIRYRGRSIPFTEIKEIRVKNNRFMLNHFATNQGSPKMCILFVDKNRAEWFHDEMLDAMYYK